VVIGMSESSSTAAALAPVTPWSSDGSDVGRPVAVAGLPRVDVNVQADSPPWRPRL